MVYIFDSKIGAPVAVSHGETIHIIRFPNEDICKVVRGADSVDSAVKAFNPGYERWNLSDADDGRPFEPGVTVVVFDMDSSGETSMVVPFRLRGSEKTW